MKKMMIAVLMMFTLCACGSKSEPITETYELVEDAMTVTNTITFEDDKVLKQQIVSVMDLEAVGITVEAITPTIDSFKEKYNVEGVEYNPVFDGNTLTETTTIDYEKADMDELKAAELITIPAGAKANYISYKVTVEGFEKMGFVKK